MCQPARKAAQAGYCDLDVAQKAAYRKPWHYTLKCDAWSCFTTTPSIITPGQTQWITCSRSKESITWLIRFQVHFFAGEGRGGCRCTCESLCGEKHKANLTALATVGHTESLWSVRVCSDALWSPKGAWDCICGFGVMASRWCQAEADYSSRFEQMEPSQPVGFMTSLCTQSF